VSERDPAQDPLAGLGINAGFAAEVRERWEVDPASVEESWQRALAGEGAAALEAPPRNGAAARPPLTGTAEAPAATGGPAPAVAEAAAPGDVARVLHITDKNARVLRLIHSYRARGHRVADSDPLGGQSNYFPELDPAHYGFGNHDMDQPFTTGDLPGGSVQTLREILERLRRTYCGKIGVEYTHVQDPGRKAWLQQRMEESQNEPRMSDEQRSRVYEKLSAAEYFERFLHTKFVGQKRFSLEGAEAMIPLLDYVVESAPAHGINELVLGMSHRGRLNVLCNVLGKSYEAIFSEFEDNPDLLSPFGSGDVKYHKGFSSDRRVASGESVACVATPPELPFAPAADVFVEVDAGAESAWLASPDGAFEPVETLGGEPWGRGWLVRGEVLAGVASARVAADVARAAYLAAAGRRLVDDAADHARARRQFGRAIGEFQAVAHPLADAAIALDGAVALARAAAWHLDAGSADAAAWAGAARISATRASVDAIHTAHQVFGAVGITVEGPAFHVSRRIRQVASSPPGDGPARAAVLDAFASETRPPDREGHP